MKRKKINRNIEIITKVLLPSENLATIAKAYGISDGRIQQIFESEVKQSYKRIKSKLFLAANVRCLWCGDRIRMNNKFFEKGWKYCDARCRRNAYNYEDTPKSCFTCKRLFLPLRNNKFHKFFKVYCSKKCFNQ